MALQIKGTASLIWNEDKTNSGRRAVFSGIPVATANYWMGLPVPVFLCVHEHTSNGIYFAPVKHQVRRRYREFRSQSTFGFDLRSTLNLSEPDADVLLMALYFRERSRSSFTTALTDLLSNRDLYLDHIEGNVERDFFMEVETPEVLRVFTLYRNVATVADATGLSWSIPPLDDFVRNDRVMFKDEYCILHERTHDELLRVLAPLFVAAVEQGCRLVETLERDYWEERDFLLTRYISEYGANSWVEGAKARLNWILPRPSRDTA